MSTFTQIIYQVVFGSRKIIPFLNSQNQDRLFAYLAARIRNMKCIPYKVGGNMDHIHLIVSIHPSVSLSDFVGEVKKSSGNMIKENMNDFYYFPGWQRGYGGFTYPFSARYNLASYVENQGEHHKKESFEEEYIRLLEEHGIEFERKYLFD